MARETHSSLRLEADKGVTAAVETFCLIGKIISDTVVLNKHLVKSITHGKWKCKKYFSVSDIGQQNTFMFSFEDGEDWMKTLLTSPWTIKGGLLILSPWSSGKVLHEFHFSSSPFWVQVHGLPLDYLTVPNGYNIGHDLGTPICVDRKVFDGMIVWGKVMRIRVVVDIRNPLKTGFHLRRGGGLPDVWVDFKYERLSQFCYSCGRIGHVYTKCKFPKSSVKFGPWLRAAAPDAAVYETHCSGVGPRGVDRRSREVCTSSVALPPSKAITNQSMEKVCPGVESGRGDFCSDGATQRYLWKKLIINSIDSISMAMNSAIIYSKVSYAKAYDGNGRLLMVIAAHLIYLVLKLTYEVRSSRFLRGYNARKVPLAERGMKTFVEVLISVVLFLTMFFP